MKKKVLIFNDLCFLEKKDELENFSEVFHYHCLFSSFEKQTEDHVAAILLSENIGETISLLKTKFPEAILVIAWDPGDSKYTFSELKEKFAIDFILEIPLNMQEVGAVFRLFSRERKDDIDDLPEELLKKYEVTIPQKIEEVTRLATALQTTKSIEAATAFKKEIHKIAGSSSAYGFRQVGDLCKSFELFIINSIGEEASVKSLSCIIEKLPHFLRQFRLFFQRIYPTATSTPDQQTHYTVKIQDKSKEAKGRVIDPAVMMLTSDTLLTKLFQDHFSDHEMKVIVESNPHVALQWIRDTQSLPKCVVVESFYPELRMSGKEMLSLIQEKDTEKRCIFTLILDEDELQKRIESIEEGFHFLIRRGFPNEHLESLKRALMYRQQTIKVRVLLVDDDQDMNRIVTNTLQEMGMKVESLSDETKLLDKIQSFKPDVLLLDLGLTTYSGLNILKTIRMDIHSQGMIVIIFTMDHSEKTMIEVFDAGADEIILKPFHPRLVKARIMNMMRRYHSLGIKRASDKSTSMLDKHDFFLTFNDTYSNPSKNGKQVSLLLFQIDNFAGLKTHFGPNYLEELSYGFAHAIRQFFKSAQLLGHFREDQYGVVIENLSGGEIEYLLSRFRDFLWKNFPLIGGEGHRINFSNGVCILRIGDEQTISTEPAAECALNSAIRRGPGGLEIVRLKKEWKEEQKPVQIVVIHKDHNISDLLAMGFKKHGIAINQIYSGTDAKRYFLNLNSLNSKSIVVMEHPLPDFSTTELIQMISIKFSNQIPVLCLTSTTDENEMVNILKAGANDIIQKPFSTKVLMSKSLRLLYGKSH